MRHSSRSRLFACVGAMLIIPVVVHAGNQPICPFALGWNGTLQNWASTAPWIKILWKADIPSAKALGCKVFYRPYDIPGHDDSDLPASKTGAQMANEVLAVLNTISRNSWPDAVGYRNEWESDVHTATEFINYYDTLRAGGYTGIIVYGSYATGAPDMREWGKAEVQAAIDKADAIETHEYFDLTIKYYDSWTSHRHVRDMNQYPYLRSKPWLIGEFGSDASPYSDREDPCLRVGWRDTGTCGEQKLTPDEYITQIGIYRAGDPANDVLAVADNVVAVFMFGQGSGSWWQFDVLGTPVADYLQTTWTRTPGSITGTVRDLSNHPLAGVAVRTDLGSHAGPGPYSTTTDANGNYTLGGVAPWAYTVIAGKDGYQTLSRSPVSVLYATATPCDFSLGLSGSIAGYVRDGGGHPLNGAEVSTTSGGYATLSAADGSYTLTGLAVGTYTVTAVKAGYSSGTKTGVTVVSGQTTSCDFNLQLVGTNLATSAVTYLACGHANLSETGIQGHDGNTTTKWCCLHNGNNTPGDHWLIYDLGSNATVTQYVVKNVSLMGEPSSSPGTWDTRGFVIESGPSLQGPWTAEYTVTNNASATWSVVYGTPKVMRFVRLRVTQPTQDNSNWAVRVPEFEVWGFVGIAGPIQFEAEDYDSGANAAEGLDYHDTTSGNSGVPYRTQDVDIEACSEGGYDVIMAAGEWLKYPVRGAGEFQLSIRCACTATATCHLEVGGVNVTGAVALPATGGNQNWQTLQGPTFSLGTGDHSVRFVNDSGTLRLNYFLLTPPVPIPCDFDGDGDVDQSDFGRFQLCLTGSGYLQDDPACSKARLDGDVDVDGDDFVLFYQCLSGPNVPGNPNCLD